jgi:hypothetical protein
LQNDLQGGDGTYLQKDVGYIDENDKKVMVGGSCYRARFAILFFVVAYDFQIPARENRSTGSIC